MLSNSNTTSIPTSQYDSGLAVSIGDRRVGGTPFSGRIDDVYNRVLSASEIASLAQ